MDFVAVVDQVLAILRQRGRVTYRTLKLQFTLDDEQLATLKAARQNNLFIYDLGTRV